MDFCRTAMLLQPSIHPSLEQDILNALRNYGISTVTDLIACDPQAVTRDTKIPYNVLIKLKQTLLNQFSPAILNGANLYDQMLKHRSVLPTGNKILDALFDGGIYSNEITEVYGPSCSGKTRFCLMLAANVALQCKKEIIYVDTNGSFTASALKQMMERRIRADVPREKSARAVKKAMGCVHVMNAVDGFELADLTYQLCHQPERRPKKLKLIIIDSLGTVFSPCIGGDQTLGASMLNGIGHALRRVASDAHLSVLVVNNALKMGDKFYPTLGVSWISVPRVRALFTDTGAAYLIKSCRKAVPSAAVHPMII